MRDAVRLDEPELREPEGDRRARPDHGASWRFPIGGEPRGQVEGDDGSADGVNDLDRCRDRAGRGAAHARAQQGVDDEVGVSDLGAQAAERVAGGVGRLGHALTGALEGVETRMTELMKGRREKVVFFTADNEVGYDYVIKVMDAMRGGSCSISSWQR